MPESRVRFEGAELLVAVAALFVGAAAVTEGGLRDAFLLLTGLMASYGLWLARQRERRESEGAWKASQLRFEEAFRSIARWLQEHCASMYGRTLGELLGALESYPPDLAGGPLQRWAQHNEWRLGPAERAALALGRMLYNTYSVTDTPEDRARKAMTGEVQLWNGWASEPRYRAYALQHLDEHRGKIVLHAYLEVGCAESVKSAVHAPEWAPIGERLPNLFRPRPAISGSSSQQATQWARCDQQPARPWRPPLSPWA